MGEIGKPNLVLMIRTGVKKGPVPRRDKYNESQEKIRTQNKRICQILNSLCWRDVYSNAPYFEENIGGRSLVIKQLKNGETTGLGTGATVWPAACVMMKYLEHRFGKAGLHRKSVLELGSGTGAVGLATLLLGASKVVLTDLPQLLALLNDNLLLLSQKNPNISVRNASAKEFMWGARSNDFDQEFFDYVIVSDCILPKLYPIEPLVQSICWLCKEKNTRVLISYEQRYYEQFDPKDSFLDSVTAKGFLWRQIPHSEFHPNYIVDDIEIWEIYH